MTGIPLEWILAALGGLVVGFILSSIMHYLNQRRLRETFRALSSEALHNNNTLFLDIAKNVLARQHDVAKNELDTRHGAVAALLQPFQESLAKIETQNRELEKARAESYGALRQHLTGLVDVQQQLRLETAQLKQVLRRPEGRGRWGEMQLRRLLEMAGMLEYCDFVEQASDEKGIFRPDVIVTLPLGRQIVIDCKTPLDALMDAAQTEHVEARAAHIARHARNVREHVKNLSVKAYWNQFENTPDFVVMFVPGEHFLSEALQHDGALFEYAFNARVILATPLNLIGLLKTIAHNWRQEHLAQDARRIAKLGQELYEAMAYFSAPLENLGDALRKAVDHYNKAINVLENRALAKARRLKEEFDLQSDKTIEVLEPLDTIPRPLAQPEPDTILAPEDGEKKKDVA